MYGVNYSKFYYLNAIKMDWVNIKVKYNQQLNANAQLIIQMVS